MKKLKTEELGRVSVDEYKNLTKIPVHLFLDNIRSAHNVGSVFRTADAFRVEKIWLTGITAKPPHKEIRKTALGATESVEWEYVQDPSEAMKQIIGEGVQPVAVEQTDESRLLTEFEPADEQKYCFILGNEVFGISDEVLEQCSSALEIPQYGTKHSFNVSVTAGILLWDFYLKRPIK